MATLFAFLHFLAAFVMFATLALEISLTRRPDEAAMRRVAVIDAVYGIAALLVLVAGLLRVFHFEKGAAYYGHSLPFMIKMALFAAIGILSIYPTTVFVGWRRALARGSAPVVDAARLARLRRVIHIEATLFVLMVLCASMMAHGVGVMGR